MAKDTDLSTDLARMWPPFGLRVVARTPHSFPQRTLVLRTMRDEDIAAIHNVTAADIFGPVLPSYVFPWLEDPSTNAAAFRWSQRLSFTPSSWTLPLAVLTTRTSPSHVPPADTHATATELDGSLEVIGSVDLRAVDFGASRSIDTGSWLYHRLQGQGVGTLVRHAVAVLAFAHLGARELTTSWHVDNAASAGVSRKLGYELITPSASDTPSLNDSAATGARDTIQADTAVSPSSELNTPTDAPTVKARLPRKAYHQPADVTVEVTGLTPELRKLMGMEA